MAHASTLWHVHSLLYFALPPHPGATARRGPENDSTSVTSIVEFCFTTVAVLAGFCRVGDGATLRLLDTVRSTPETTPPVFSSVLRCDAATGQGTGCCWYVMRRMTKALCLLSGRRNVMYEEGIAASSV
ncbi:hypothetical protein DQ04_11281010 [Trypanosoma grayi]|uniref:hypothetical protein n=1 Tax=Trypanosoma grayi TaxID=71804 RepID=UPI0004F49B64|nr:hypothetical protein DQ04_11281010 [Trypanosoma grayi]KEG07007.1 hypothetical protein DQ04_11281010 [Trypanosoma grayi]